MITDEKLKSMRTAGYLIEPPAGEVIASLVDEIFEYKQRIAELEAALQYERNFPSHGVERRRIV